MIQHCPPGAYCRAGLKTGIVMKDTNTSTPGVCKHGMICHEGAVDIGGIGECPTGYYCPRPYHVGIPCPPRHYCPKRGNTKPILCPKGTFNMHFG